MAKATDVKSNHRYFQIISKAALYFLSLDLLINKNADGKLNIIFTAIKLTDTIIAKTLIDSSYFKNLSAMLHCIASS